MPGFGAQPSRLGQIDTEGDVDALFLKVFSGEVLTTFEENNIMMPLHRVRTITSGKSAQFPTTGVAAAAYHNPGESLFHQSVTTTLGEGAPNTFAQTNANKYLSSMPHSEVTISIDGVLTSSAFLADIDEAKNHYEVRSIYSTEIGRQLAYTADRNLIQTVIAGGRKHTPDRFGNDPAQGGREKYTGAVLNLGDGAVAANSNEIRVHGATTTDVDPTSCTGAQILSGLAMAAEVLDEKNVPSEGRYCLLPPTQYYKLVTENNDALNRDYGNDGNGSIASGVIVSAYGVRILKSNHVPTLGTYAISTDPAVNNDVFGVADAGYDASFTTTVGTIFQTEAVGTVKLLDLSMESEYYMDRLGTLLMAKYAMGHGVLRAEACVEMIART
tara:strand:- start:359 stop:1513 length:1155 start_codon:yes stop_codon:yes gene_type:complete